MLEHVRLFVYNRYPAKIFMGDTGSMFIGSAMTAVSHDAWASVLVVAICFTMIMSSLSVILQRAYFKATMASVSSRCRPFIITELSGMKENQIVIMYALVTLGLSILALLMAIPLMG